MINILFLFLAEPELALMVLFDLKMEVKLVLLEVQTDEEVAFLMHLYSKFFPLHEQLVLLSC